MIPVPSGMRVWIAAGPTDMRCGMNSLALRIQQALGRDPHAGDLYVFRGKSGKLIKVFWYDGLGASLYAKRLEKGRFCLAGDQGWHGGDYAWAARLSARRDRLASAATDLAATSSGLIAAL
jgi:transposase